MTTRLFIPTFLLFSIASILMSCNKSLDQPGFPGFRCSFGNTEWIADTAYYTRQGVSTTIYAYKNGIKTFQLYLQQADTTGSFPLDSVHNTAYYFTGAVTAPGTLTLRSISGSCQITEYYNDSLSTCSGNFNFFGRTPGAGNNWLEISYGYFNNIHRQ